jgi:ankyrin repeat protein
MATLYDIAHFCSWNGYTEDMRSYLGVDRASWTNREFWSPHGANLLYGPSKKSRIQCIAEHGQVYHSRDILCYQPLRNNYDGAQRIRELIADGAKPDIKDVNGWTALLVCSRNGWTQHLDMIKVLLDAGADVNQRNITYDFTPLMLSSYNGHIAIVQELIRRGADVRFTNKGDRPAIEYAAEGGHLDVVKVLIASGAVVTDGVFAQIIKHGHVAMLKYILTIARPPQDAVFDAVYHNQPHIIRLLAKAGANMNLQNPAHLAIEENYNECLRALCIHGANLNLLDEANDSPLRQAILEGNHEAIRILASYKANINEVTNDRPTPLIHYAIDMYKSFPEENRKKTLLAMIDAGPDFKILDSYGNTPAEHAYRIPDIVTLIKRAEMKQRFSEGRKTEKGLLLGAKALSLDIKYKRYDEFNNYVFIP